MPTATQLRHSCQNLNFVLKPITPHHLPQDRSPPNNPVLQRHASHFFRESHLGPTFYYKVKGVVPFVPGPRRLSPGKMCWLPCQDLTHFPSTGMNGLGKYRFLLNWPTPSAHLVTSRPSVGTSAGGLGHCSLPSLSRENLLPVGLINIPKVTPQL